MPHRHPRAQLNTPDKQQPTMIEATHLSTAWPTPQQPENQRHRPLQHPLLLLHAGDNVEFMDRGKLLTLKRSNGSFGWRPVGNQQMRLTGGSRWYDENPSELIGRLSTIEGIDDIGLTTNGILLADQAPT
ncbi:MAG: hypothetical protein Ct9H300mP1_28800 [Planctomycetaceae bacterium]|nr:MAG: hypothetical protein Ct9H300mP1_28800 [Planctomycetaceae bacterium]